MLCTLAAMWVVLTRPGWHLMRGGYNRPWRVGLWRIDRHNWLLPSIDGAWGSPLTGRRETLMVIVLEVELFDHAVEAIRE